MNNKINMLVEEVQNLMGSEYEVDLRTIEKNNGIKKNAIQVKGKDTKLYPNIYIDDENLEGFSVNELASDVCKEINENIGKSRVLDTNKVELTKDSILENVFMTIIGREKNIELLDSVPNKEFLDMAIVLRVGVEIGSIDGYNGSFLLNNSLTNTLEIDVEELWAAAMRNTKVGNIEIYDLEQVVMCNFLCESKLDIPVMTYENMNFENGKMYVLSNKNKLYGAVYIANKMLMNRIGNLMGGDFYILPSSVHEILIFRTSHDDTDDLKRIVNEVNHSEVSPEEVLTNSVYRYDSKNGKVVIA